MLEFLYDKLDGDTWEEICTFCYRQRYQKDHYTEIIATYKGDGGIEGFTKNGVVNQCYCPEKKYTDDQLYENQRDKVTKDIGKLLKNGDIYKGLGLEEIREWHFVTPYIKDKRIIEHCTKKKKEVLDANKTYISPNFDIHIKVADDFVVEVNRYINLNSNLKYAFSTNDFKKIDLDKCPSEQRENIDRKVRAIKEHKDTVHTKLVDKFTEDYLKWVMLREKIAQKSPELYESILKAEEAYKRELEVKCAITSETEDNLFLSTMIDFEDFLIKEFGEIIEGVSIKEMKQDIIATWLAECPLDFY